MVGVDLYISGPSLNTPGASLDFPAGTLRIWTFSPGWFNKQWCLGTRGLSELYTAVVFE